MWNLNKWYKMVLLIKKSSHRLQKTNLRLAGGKLEGGINWEIETDLHIATNSYNTTYSYKKNRQLIRTYCISQGTLLNNL